MTWLGLVLGMTLAGDPPPIQRPTGMVAPAPAPAYRAPTAPVTTSPPVAASPPAPTVQPNAIVAPSPAPADDSAADPTQPATEPAPAPPARIDAQSMPEASGPGNAGALRRTHDEDEPFPHRGFVADVLIGPMGCVKGMCEGDRHAISTGVRASGFIGGNIRGWVELGLGGGWGSMRSRAAPGTNALLMYGLDPWLLQQALSAAAAGLLKVDLAGLSTTRTRMQTAQAGPMARINFIPRGRMLAWGGAGLEYHLLRNRYDTQSGPVRLDFHGLAVPIQAAVGVYVHEHVAITAQFDYLWTWYGLAVLDHPDQKTAIPVAVLQQAAQLQGVDLRGELPQFWTVGIGLRGRI
jgi:hypothetical protein